MRLLTAGLLLSLTASAQQMISMRASGDMDILTIRVNPTNFVTISGAPYSGTRVTTGVQIRTDGTRVDENRTALFYRDSSGRNRTERPVSIPGSPVMVTIMDPALGCEYVLSPGDKTAYKLTGVHVRTEPLGDYQASAASLETATESNLPAVPGGAQTRTEDLGNQTMQGLQVHGVRTSTIWPAGTFNNNDREITTTVESWSYPALGNVVISSKTSRPNLIEDYSVSGVKLGDPEPSLFAPPPDYRVVEQSSDFQILIPRTALSNVTKLSSHGVGPATVSGAPFSGVRTVVSIQALAGGAHEEHPERTAFLAWRDSQGRVRTEWPGQGTLPDTVEIQDPVAGFAWSLDYAAKVARRTAFTPPPVESLALPANAQSLGSQMISGVPANGNRFTAVRAAGVASATGQPGTASTETWVAGKEGVTLLEKVTGSDGSQSTIAMKFFSTVEPDPSLFRIPATYRVVDESGNEIAAATAHPPVAAAVTAPPGAVRATPQEAVFTFRAFPNMNLPAVTRAPYSIQSTSQTQRTLPAAVTAPNQIASTTSTYRDSMGRTRRDAAPPQQQISLPQIDDPVSGYRYILDPVHHVAHRSVVSTRKVTPSSPAPAVVPATPATSQTVSGGMTITTESLGTRMIDGLPALGMKTTTQSSAAGGPNMVMESWSSLQYGVVLRQSSTGANSNTVTTTKGFSPAEPDPALFRIPADYKIVDEDGDFTISIPLNSIPSGTDRP